jgi:hypothetical protein
VQLSCYLKPGLNCHLELLSMAPGLKSVEDLLHFFITNVSAKVQLLEEPEKDKLLPQSCVGVQSLSYDPAF